MSKIFKSSWLTVPMKYGGNDCGIKPDKDSQQSQSICYRDHYNGEGDFSETGEIGFFGPHWMKMRKCCLMYARMIARCNCCSCWKTEFFTRLVIPQAYHPGHPGQMELPMWISSPAHPRGLQDLTSPLASPSRQTSPRLQLRPSQG